MKTFLTLAFSFFMFNAFAQKTKHRLTKNIQIVEASCGQCNLGLPGEGCDLAVRINGIAYFVDGTSIDKHGDAHAKKMVFATPFVKPKCRGK